jgi:hypothetical protein
MDTQALTNFPNLNHLTAIIAAVGGLGTASYGIVDVTKSFAGGVSNCGFACIAKTMATLIPEKTPAAAADADTSEPATPPALSLSSMLITLKSNWINGMASDDQRAIAKILVKLRLNADLVPVLATLTGVNPATLASVAAKIASGTPLDKDETDVYGRFDLVLTTILDQAYQRADQQYRNAAKLCAVFVSIILAVVGAWSLGQIQSFFLTDRAFWNSVLLGLLATPLAPVAKDIASAVQAGAKAAQAWGS